MDIDPRYMEQLMRIRFLDTSGNLSGNSSRLQTDSDNEFADWINSYMQMASATLQDTIDNAMNGAESLNRLYYQNFRPLNMTDYDQIIDEASARYQVDARLIRAIIQTESGYKADALSKAGAKGLMQLMDDTAAGLGVSDPYDPRQNIEGGTKFLAYLLQKYNGMEAIALAAYNAGPGRIDRLGIDSMDTLQSKFGELPVETQNYIGKVLGIRNAIL